MLFTFSAKVWSYQGLGGWHFATLPVKQSQEIKRIATKARWGSIPVLATIGETTWKTSIFPKKNSQSYDLPLKATVRKKEGINEGDTTTIHLDI